MRGGSDDAVLTDQERRALASLEAAVARDDPALDARLRTGRREWPWSPVALLVSASFLFAVGAIVTVATFTWSLALALFGVGLQAAGITIGAIAMTKIVRQRQSS